MTSDALAKARKAKAAKNADNRRTLIAEVLKDRPCTCGITPNSTDEELRELMGGCTMPYFACPTLDSLRRIFPHYAPMPEVDNEPQS